MLETPAVIDANGFADWLSSSVPGDNVEYHRGFLARERTEGCHPRWRDIDAVGEAAWRAHKVGLVHLVQRTLGANGHAYLAIRRHPSRSKEAQ